MEEERIKSALEIALERISALPELTPEEMAAQKEKQYRPIGEAAAARFLSGLFTENDLTAELEKYRPDQRQIVQRAVVSILCRTISLDGSLESAARALKGIAAIAPEKSALIEKTQEEFFALLRDFGQEKEKQEKAAEIDISPLSALGISGTAVRCNPAENAYWRERLNRIRQSYEPRLEALRSFLECEIMSE